MTVEKEVAHRFGRKRVMAQGGGKVIYKNDECSKTFIIRLGQLCDSHGWNIHWISSNGRSF